MTIRFGTSGWQAVTADEFTPGRSPKPAGGYSSELREVFLSNGRTLGPIYETPVGFRYIGESINEDKIVIVGEAAARLSIKGHTPEKDGILACLLAAETVAARGKGLTQQTGRGVCVGIGKGLGGAS